MDIKPLLSTFVLIFLAELGDKTQIAAVCQAAEFQRPWMVLIGASVALIVVSAIGVGVGHCCGQFLPTDIIRYIAGGLFIVMGVLLILNIM
ncbi:MAG: TMEM165/GDT1 family protein [Armatimonadota bacterium]